MKNLFDYATKELSQDAFLRWLIENYNCECEEVCEQSKKLLSAFSGVDNLDSENISELKTYAQWKKIDVLIHYKYEGKLYCIAVEDKVFSEEHNNQLQNYNKKLNDCADWWKNQYKCEDYIIKKIYYKPTKLSEDEKGRVKEAGWDIFDIDKITNIFHENISSSSEILNGYRKHIAGISDALNTIQKPTTNENNIDYIKWQSYFEKRICPGLSQNGYKVGVWKAGQYPYICLVVKKDGFLENSPYLEVRSRDCLADNFVARILLYGVERDTEKFDTLKENIKNYTSFTCQNYKKQIGESPSGLKAETDEKFIALVEQYAKEFLTVMKDWHL